jgi:hypothetical protein
MTSVMGDGNREGEVMGCIHFFRGREGGGEVSPRCLRQMTQRRVARWPGRPKAAASVWKSKMTKGNWLSGPNCRLVREKNMAKSTRWARKIGEEILAGQNKKKE